MTETIARSTVDAATTVAARVHDRAGRTPDLVAMREKDLGIWHEVTWAAYWDTVQTVAHALLALGVEPGDRVAIHSENRREWLYTDVATAIRAVDAGQPIPGQVDFPGIADGVIGMAFIEAAVKSSAAGAVWIRPEFV